MKRKSIKLLVLILILSLTFGLAACTPKPEPAPEPQPAAAEAPVQEAPKTDIVADVAKAYFANMPQDIYKIGEKEFIELVKVNNPDIFILDIRQPDVYGEGHIKGAVNAPFGMAIAESLGKLPKDKTIMVYCYTGQTAGQAVAFLNMAGFDAKSVNLGWVLGISKVEGVADVIEKEPNDFPQVTPLDIKPEVKAAIEAHFKGLGDVKGTTYANYMIGEEDAKTLVDSKDDSVLFLSVRKAEDYAKGHIEGAVNIPFAKGMQEKFDTLPKDKTIIVYCYTGQTANQVVAVLRALGYNAVSLKGGIGMPSNAPNGWANKGFPVVQ